MLIIYYCCLIHRDDTVAVGSNLYELDTEGTVSQDTSIQTSAPIEAVKETAKVEPIVINSKEPIMETGTASEHRSPTIKFLGKSGWEAALKGHSSEPAPIVVAVASKPNAVTTIVDDTIIHPMYGRPRFTDTEMEALITGGATIAPLVLMHSSGAKFK